MIIVGDNHMSPGILASMWKDEEAKTKLLETKMAALLREKKVNLYLYFVGVF